ncbi:MAG: hypothetical protein EAZ91_00340 [Cytophagales bacterium]|nr:MAG: hypothetical protein EAZ91_00340 [Cytophagales bacterium]
MDVQREDDYLRFKDRRVFEQYSTSLGNVPKGMELDKFLSSAEEKYDFKSLRAANATSKTESGARVAGKPNSCIEDDYLASMLNPDGIVQIDQWIFRLDVCAGKVFVLAEKDKAMMAELKKKMPTHKAIRVFSTDDEVLDLLSTTKPGAKVAICFNDRRADGATDQTFQRHVISSPTINTYSVEYFADAKVVYQKAGIYFSLLAELKYMRRLQDDSNWFWNQEFTSMNLLTTYRYKRRCGDESGDSEFTFVASDNKINKRVYESSNGLARYSLSGDFTYVANHTSPPQSTTFRLAINDGY